MKTDGDYVAWRNRAAVSTESAWGGEGETHLGSNNYREVLYTGDYSCGDAINQESWVLALSGDGWNYEGA